MSDLYAQTTSGLTVRFIYWNSADQVYSSSGSAFTSWVAANIANYKFAATEKTSSGTYYPDASPPAGWTHATAVNNADNSVLGTFDRDPDVIAVKAKTDNLPSSPSSLDAAGVRAAVGLASANLDTQLGAIDDYLDTEIAAIKAKTDLIPASPSTLDAAGVRSAVGLASANLDTQLGAIDDYLDTEIAAIKAKTDLIPASPSTLDAAGVRAAVGLASANLDTQLGAIDDYLGTEIAAIKAKTDLIPTGISTFNPATDPVDVGSVNGSTLAADNLAALYSAGVTAGEIDDATPTAGGFTGAAGLSSDDDAYNGLILVFTSGPNVGRWRKISDYVGSTRAFSFGGAAGRADAPFPEAPTDDDAFLIGGRSG